MHAFTPDAAAALPGPAWLVSRRVAAAERFAATSLPSADEEVWRYSRIGELDLEAYQPLQPHGEAPAGLPAATRAVLESVGTCSGAVVLCDGRIVHRELSAEAEAAGVIFGRIGETDAAADDLLDAVVGPPADDADAFRLLNAAFSVEPIVLSVPARRQLSAPFVVVHWISASGIATFPRVVVSLGEGAAATLLDWYASGQVQALTVPLVELDVAQGAHLGVTAVQDRAETVWHVATTEARVGQQGALVAAQVALGGDYARSRVDCRLEGRGADGRLLAAYFGHRRQMLDFRTFQHHLAPDTSSDLLFKGAVDDDSHSVYTGLIRVAKEARGTTAFQTNRNLKLGEHAWAESVPNLEIDNNEVKCSHASTMGPIDADQRFYLESRGVPTDVAERLVVTGFFGEVLERLPVRAIEPVVRERIRRRAERADYLHDEEADA